MAGRRRILVLLVVVALVVVGCGNGSTVRTTAPGAPVLVRVTGAVEEADGAWRVCLGGDGPCWNLAAGDRTLRAGTASVTGRWDGTTLTVTADPVAVEREMTFPNPCPDVAPMGGTNGDDHLTTPVQEYLQTIGADYAGSWLARPGPVLVVAVVDNLDLHRAEIDRRADRGMCVTSDGFRYSQADLYRVQEELRFFDAEWRSKGYANTWSSTDVVNNVVEVGFDQVDPVLVAELDERWGHRVVARAVIEVLEGTVSDLPRRETDSDEIAIDISDLGGGHMEALGTFVLRYDAERDCVWFDAAGERVKPVFPAGWHALRDPVRILDARGKVVATVDGTFETGGGFGRPPTADDPFACGATSTWVI